MNKKILFAAVALLAAASVFAGTLQVVSSFASRKTWRKGLDYEGGYIYSTSNHAENCIHKYTTGGALVGTIPAPWGSVDQKWDGSYIWVCTYNPAYIYRLTATGSIVTWFARPGDVYGHGLAWTGTHLYYSSIADNVIWCLTTTGSVVTSFPSHCSLVGGLDYDGTNLWVSDWLGSDSGLKYLTTSGSFIDSFSTPGASRPSGVCWDGAYVWYNEYNLPPYVYRARVQFSAVAPASLGKVKALFK